jgi:hypothetical protein
MNSTTDATSDAIPPYGVLLERLRAENKQPTVKVPPCLGCGGLPHEGVRGNERCVEAALKAAREEVKNLSTEVVVLRTEVKRLRGEVQRLTELTERQDRMAANASLQSRGR